MSDERRALITGAAGQDGYYLSELLISQGWRVFGLTLRHSDGQHDVFPGVEIIEGDITDMDGLRLVFSTVKPHEVYNLAAQSHAGLSFKFPCMTAEVNYIGALHILELCQSYGAALYQASSSEMFGDTPGPLNELSPMEPSNPYAVAKLAAHKMVRLYRRSYCMRAVAGILFNHESPRRSPDFVTQKVCTAAARVSLGLSSNLKLGYLDGTRDWGHARDYVRAMPMMLRKEKPDDYVIATGESHTVRELIFEAERVIGQTIPYEIDQQFMRPRETAPLRADPSRAREELGWEPKIRFSELVKEMVEAAAEKLRREHFAQSFVDVPGRGYVIPNSGWGSQGLGQTYLDKTPGPRPDVPPQGPMPKPRI